MTEPYFKSHHQITIGYSYKYIATILEVKNTPICDEEHLSEQAAGQDGFGNCARQVQQTLGHHPRSGELNTAGPPLIVSNQTVFQLGEYTVGELKKTIAGKKPKYRDINR